MRSFPFPNPFLFFFPSSASSLREKPRLSSHLAHTQPRLCQGHGLFRLPPENGPRQIVFLRAPSDACATTDTNSTKGSTSIPSSGTPEAGPKAQRIFRHGRGRAPPQRHLRIQRLRKIPRARAHPPSTRPFTPSTPTSHPSNPA